MSFDLPNYTQFPNSLVDLHMRTMTEAELKVVLAVLRETLGADRKEAGLSTSHLVELTGLSSNSVIRGAKRGIKRGLIAKLSEKRTSTATYSPAFKLPHLVRKASSLSEEVPPQASSLSEEVPPPASSLSEEISSTSEEVRRQLTNINKQTNVSPAVRILLETGERTVTPRQAEALTQAMKSLGEHEYRRLIEWAADRPTPPSTSNILRAARKWRPEWTPEQQEAKRGIRNTPERRSQSNGAGKHASNRPSPEQLARDLEMARAIKARQGRL